MSLQTLVLPTIHTSTLSQTEFAGSLRKGLKSDKSSTSLSLFFYAAKVSGWDEIASHVVGWKNSGKRSAEAFIGLDDGITDPDALQAIQACGVSCFIPNSYAGVYHPKVAWLNGAAGSRLWFGSNNLSQAGLTKNAELGALVEQTKPDSSFLQWVDAIRAVSTPLTPALLSSYRRERNAFERKRAGLGRFIWSGRQKFAPKAKLKGNISTGSLIVAVTPRETGSNGKQVQIPLEAARSYFGLGTTVGSSKQLRLIYVPSGADRTLTFTLFAHSMARLSIAELDFDDRPCFLVFERNAANTYRFQIISRATEPSTYAALTKYSINQQTATSKVWGVMP